MLAISYNVPEEGRTMPELRNFAFWVVAAAAWGSGVAAASAQSDPQQGSSASTAAGEQRDFDFEIGTWKSHSRRRLNPLTGSTTWVEFDGIAVVRKIWDGRANLVELNADGSAGPVHGLSLRLYDPTTRRWSLYYGSVKSGVVSVPAVGRFVNGRGEFYDQEVYHGKTIMVRNVWSEITRNSCHFEQAFSADGGKSWEVNLITTDIRSSDAENQAQ
jgi:hypothetical protein